MDWKLTVLLLLFVQLVSAAELKLDGELHYNTLEVTLQNQADYSVDFILKTQLKKREESWILLDTPCIFNGSIGPRASKEFECNYTTPEEPGQYKIYARANILNSTFTYKDFLFDVDQTGFKEPKSEKEVTLQIISAPEKVKTGEEFPVKVKVFSSKETALEIYSYVHSGKTCYSLHGWKGNAQKYAFKENEAKIFNLTNIVTHNALNGTYSLKVRARGDKDWDIARNIRVEKVPPDLFKEVPKKEAARVLDVEDNESKSTFNWLLPLLAFVPLILLLYKKVF